MKTTRYFEEQVLRKRPYLEREWFAPIMATPIRLAIQPDGRVRYWGRATDPRDGRIRVRRIVALEDGETIHNAFFDRGYQES